MALLFLLLWTFFLFVVTPGEAMSFQEMKAKLDNANPPTCYRSYKAPLDLVFIIDRTSEKVMQMMPKLGRVIDLLGKEYPESRFGMSYFADFQCTDWHSAKTCRILLAQNKEHNDPEGCYTFKSGLTDNIEQIKDMTREIPLVGGRGEEAGINALLMAATDPRIRWSSTKQSDGHRNRILFLVTDDGTHCCSKLHGTSKPIVGDGSDRCSTMANPTPELAGEKLKERGINLFLGLMKEGHGSKIDVFEDWREMTERMPILAAQSDLDADNAKMIVEVFRHFMVLVVYKHGTVPCKRPSNNNVPPAKTHDRVVSRPFSPFYRRWFGGAPADKPRISMADTAKRDKINDMTYEEILSEIRNAKPPICYRDPSSPIDVVFLVDRSDMAVIQNTPALLKMMNPIQREYPRTRFGLNFFSDFICTDWNSANACPRIVNAKKDHMDPDGCYTFNTTLTHDVALINRNARDISWLASVNKESGVAALMMTAADGNVGWEGSKDEHRNRIVFVISNDGTHCCGKLFGTKNPPAGDGTDKCDLIDNPGAEFAGKILKEKNIKLFLALNNGGDDLDVFENWNEMCQQMGVTFTMVNTDRDNNVVIFKKFKEFVLRMVYADGHVPCPQPPPRKNERVGYRISPFWQHFVRGNGRRPDVKDDVAAGQRSRNKKTIEEMTRALENAKPPICYRSHENPLDVVFVIDCSAKDVLDEVPRIMKLVDVMSRHYPGSRFGLTHYSDFQCTDWNSASSCPALVAKFLDHDDPEGCYKFDVGLTTDVKKVKDAGSNIKFLGSVNKESGLAAALLASVDPKVSWPPASVTSRNKVMVVITNDATHCCGKFHNIQHLPRADGTDKCATMDNPTAEFTGEILQREGITVFMVLANGGSQSDTFKNWDEMGLKMNVTYAMANYAAEDNVKIYQKFKNFLIASVYEKGTIRCPETPRQQAPKKVSRVYQLFNVKSRPEPKINEEVEMKRPPPKPRQGEKPELSYEEIAALLKSATPPECYRDPTSPLDLIFVIDHSSKDALTKAKQILEIVDKMKDDYKGTKFGVTFYSDFTCTDWSVESECPSIIEKKWDHDDPEGCYTFKYPLGTPPDEIKTATDGMKVLPSINTESGVAGLMMTATDPEIKWPSTQMPSRNRVAFLITDDGSNCCGKIFGTRNPPKGDGTDKCISMDNPTPEFAGEKLREQGISLFLAGGNDGSATDTFENWASMATRMNVTFGMANTDEDDNTEILRKFRQFMNKVVYFAGRVPCSMIKPSERPGRK